MKLYIDIGNTYCSLFVVDGKKRAKRYFIRTSREEVCPKALRRLLGRDLGRIDGIVIVSVVPKFLSVVRKSLRSVAPRIPVSIVGKDIVVPIKIRYSDPGQVGQDRLVVSFAAARLYGAPVLVIDFGTAVTFDLVNRRGEYAGGLIFPGLRLSVETLARSAALLPEIEVRRQSGLIGRDTAGSMNRGILLGYAAMCDGIVARFRARYGKDLNVVATGGDARLISGYAGSIKRVREDLLCSGLSLLDR